MNLSKFRKLLALICIVAAFVCALPVSASSGIILTVPEVPAACGAEVEVPVILSGNTGVAGMTISVSYDSRLALKGITRGNAIPELEFTPPGNLADNPFNMVFDGLKADSSNGTVATLVFVTPTNATGKFDVKVSYTTGNIYDGDLNDLNVNIVNGCVKVANAPIIAVENIVKSSKTIDFDIKTNLPNDEGLVFVGWYDAKNRLAGSKAYAVSGKIDESVDIAGVKYVKIMCWEKNTLKPLAECIKIDL